MDVTQYIYDALSGICAVYEDEPDDDELELLTEYVIIMRVYGSERNFVNGNPTHNYHYYRINYYGTKLLRYQRMQSIKTALKSAGFFIQTDNETIPREANAKYWGAYSEFAYWEVVTDG